MLRGLQAHGGSVAENKRRQIEKQAQLVFLLKPLLESGVIEIEREQQEGVRLKRLKRGNIPLATVTRSGEEPPELVVSDIRRRKVRLTGDWRAYEKALDRMPKRFWK
ncbi:MAG: hypothetical protein V1787_06560 [Candidatus Micrarchaeota archaeon]